MAPMHALIALFVHLLRLLCLSHRTLSPASICACSAMQHLPYLPQGTRWAVEPETTLERVRMELGGPKGFSEVTIQLWMCDLVKANALYECCVVAAHSGIHPGLVRDDAGKSLLFKVVSPEAADLFTRDFDAQDPNPSFAQVSTEIFSEAGMSCLHYVRSSAIAEALVRAGANVNKRNNGRSTALFYAEHPALVKTLLRLGSDPAMVNIHNHTPAYLAASHGYWDVVFFLLKAGARANATVSATGLQPPGGVPDPLVLIDRLLAGVPTPDGRLSFPTNRGAIAKTAGLLRLWNGCGGDAADFEKRAATIAHRLIAREPAKALADACGGIPVELAEVVLYEYVGLFTKAEALLDPLEISGSWHRRRKQARGPAWTTPGDNRDAATQTDGTAARVRMWWGALSLGLSGNGRMQGLAAGSQAHEEVGTSLKILFGIVAVLTVLAVPAFWD
mmetsp:Transcript_26940/g.72306  ORF Transcript_26940/g.72306 Transcript_26940/m.72306 type:complete len:447 (+) Transcript_26940:198-1538(+)